MMQNERFTKFRREISLVLTFLIMCGLSSLLLGQWLLFGCLWWECAHSGYFDPQEIQIPRDYFPSDATYNPLFTDRHSEGAKQKEVQTVYWGNGNNSTALVSVYRYFGTSGAKRGFATQRRILQELFDISPDPSKEQDYESGSADQLFIGCSNTKCIFVARYDEDLISLSMTVDEHMTLMNFEHIMTYLDTVSAERLGH